MGIDDGGSGCLLLSVLHYAGEMAGAGRCASIERALGIDISEEALAAARGNAEALGLSGMLSFERADCFPEGSERFDLILSNPPYIAETERAELSPEVLCEPETALFGGEDGLSLYRRIIRGAGERLHPQGMLILEIGASQAEQVRELLLENGFEQIRLVKDLGGLDRVLTGVYPGSMGGTHV